MVPEEFGCRVRRNRLGSLRTADFIPASVRQIFEGQLLSQCYLLKG